MRFDRQVKPATWSIVTSGLVFQSRAISCFVDSVDSDVAPDLAVDGGVGCDADMLPWTVRCCTIHIYVGFEEPLKHIVSEGGSGISMR